MMRIYYLFVIKKELYDIYKKKETSLYKTLYKLYTASLEEYNYAYVIFNQLCDIINTSILNTYFDEKDMKRINSIYELKKNETKEHSFIKITPTYIKIKTNKNISELFKIFFYYNQNIFVCDFNEKDYFWLRECKTIKKILC